SLHLRLHRRRRIPRMAGGQDFARGRCTQDRVIHPLQRRKEPAELPMTGQHEEEVAMNLAELNKVAEAMVAPGKGILAADASSGTIKKRFDAIGRESTEESRRDYRERLFRSSEGMKSISGVILYDETIWQKAKDGTSLV